MLDTRGYSNWGFGLQDAFHFPGTAFRVHDVGTFTVADGYYYYKQVSRAGQPGMAVCRVLSNDSEVGLIGFSANGTGNPDAFVVLNLSEQNKSLSVEVKGMDTRTYKAFRTSPEERYVSLGDIPSTVDGLEYTAPPRSVTTFYAGTDSE